MHKVKILFLVAISFFLFAAGYRVLAVQPAQAQVGSMVTGFASTLVGSCDGGEGAECTVLTANGDVFVRTLNGCATAGTIKYVGNFWAGGPVPTTPASLGQVKA